MATKGTNSKSPTIRRLLKEAQELATTPSPDFHAAPSETDLFSWHFTIRGPPSSSYETGIYHGRITLPPTYPLRPPSFRFMTPTGRFEVNREICLSISGHHEETWMPAWGVRTAILALRSFMEQPSEGQVGGMDMDDASRRKLADQSISHKCDGCGKTNEEILQESAEAASEISQKGGRTLEDKVPEELKLGYKEDIEARPRGSGSEDSRTTAERQARADAALARARHRSPTTLSQLSQASSEDADIRAAAARATLAQVGVSSLPSGTSTPRAPTREDSEDLARIASMFPAQRPSPIPRAHQSPNQLEPMMGSPPPTVYRRPLGVGGAGQPAAPGQGVPAPTGAVDGPSSSQTTFHEDAFPPYLESPQPCHPSHSPLSLNEFQSASQPPPQPSRQANAVPPFTSTTSQHEINANLPLSEVRARADAAARYFESLGAAGPGAGAGAGIRQRVPSLTPRPSQSSQTTQQRWQLPPDITQALTARDHALDVAGAVAGSGSRQATQGQAQTPGQAQGYAQGQAQGQGRGRGPSTLWIDRAIGLAVTLLLLVMMRWWGIWATGQNEGVKGEREGV